LSYLQREGILFYSSTEPLVVELARYRVDQSEPVLAYTVYPEYIYENPDYNCATLENDISLLLLPEFVPLSGIYDHYIICRLLVFLIRKIKT